MEEQRVREGKRWMGKKEDIAERDVKECWRKWELKKWWGGVDGRNDRKGTKVVS